MPGDLDLFKPFLWLALIAFLVGFMSYMAFGGAGRAEAEEGMWPAAVSAPASDAWNAPKHI